MTASSSWSSKPRRPPSASTVNTPSRAASALLHVPPVTAHVRSIGSLRLACVGALLVWILVGIGLGKQLNDFLYTPLGRSFATIFFLWFALSGWLFRILIFATWVLPIAAPLLIGTVANSLVIKGACPACKREFIGYKNQIIRCASCGNIVWQAEGDFFSRNGRGKNASKSDAEIIDVDFEEK